MTRTRLPTRAMRERTPRAERFTAVLLAQIVAIAKEKRAAKLAAMEALTPAKSA